MKHRAALILDNLSISKWQANALAEAMSELDVCVILNCQNKLVKRRVIKNGLYYTLNILTLKNAMTKRHTFDTKEIKVINFDSIFQDNWQSIPKQVIDVLNQEDVFVVIKFGMGLLKINNGLEQHNILSFHHGNPSCYRGRPAGFYEILNGEKKSGIIVQKISNKLDAGEIYAFAESKIIDHSYKRTAFSFYSTSRFLLRKAVLNLKQTKVIDIKSNGKNYSLPSNLIVLKFIFIIIKNSISRLIYGMFYEKRWQVALLDSFESFQGENIIEVDQLTNILISERYNFYADPFFSEDGSKIRLEALDKQTGLGDIVEISIDNQKEQKVLLSGAHYSYPFSFTNKKNEYLLPEVANHSSQYYYDLGCNPKKKFFLKGLENKRLGDATLYKKDGCFFLFFGENPTTSSILNLWVSSSLEGEFTPHPQSPICISPSAARMGGRLISKKNKIYRLGQNNEAGYGSSLTVMEIEELTITRYSEKRVGSIKMDRAKGPHGFDIHPFEERYLLDYYEEKFSVFAGLRRIKARLSKA